VSRTATATPTHTATTLPSATQSPSAVPEGANTTTQSVEPWQLSGWMAL
jgi:hypothetical protein